MPVEPGSLPVFAARAPAVRAFEQALDPMVRHWIVPGGPLTAEAYFAACDADPRTPCRAVVTAGQEGQTCIYIDQVGQGRVFVDLTNGRVIKRVEGFAQFGLLEREARWLDRLGPSGRTPRLLARAPDTLTTEYLGEPLRQHNLPGDWRAQAQDILACLANAGCSHNDIKCDNLLVRDGRMALIDFGWSTPIGSPIPKDWPKGIGAQHRRAVHDFDDRLAIEAACTEAAEGTYRPSRRMTG